MLPSVLAEKLQQDWSMSVRKLKQGKRWPSSTRQT
jgi:hypothetical protein